MPTEKWSVTMLSFLKILGVNNMPQHKWYECLVAVAEAAKTSSEPWTVLQYSFGGDAWHDCPESAVVDLFLGSPGVFFRIKPRTITINGIEVPEPCRVKPEMGQKYYAASDLVYNYIDKSIEPCNWDDSRHANFWLNNGRIHLKEEDARAHVEAEYSGSREVK